MGLLEPTLQTQQHYNIIGAQGWSWPMVCWEYFSSDTEYALAWHWSRGHTQKFLCLHDNISISRILILPELQRISLYRLSFAWPIRTKFSRHAIIYVAWPSVFTITVVKYDGNRFGTCSVPVNVFVICKRCYCQHLLVIDNHDWSVNDCRQTLTINQFLRN